MKILDSNAMQHNLSLEKEYEKLLEEWKNAAKGRSGKEYENTLPLFDKAMDAHEKWRENLRKNGYKFLPQ